MVLPCSPGPAGPNLAEPQSGRVGWTQVSLWGSPWPNQCVGQTRLEKDQGLQGEKQKERKKNNGEGGRAAGKKTGPTRTVEGPLSKAACSPGRATELCPGTSVGESGPPGPWQACTWLLGARSGFPSPAALGAPGLVPSQASRSCFSGQAGLASRLSPIRPCFELLSDQSRDRTFQFSLVLPGGLGPGPISPPTLQFCASVS